MPNVWKNPVLVMEAAVAKEKAWKNFLNHFPKAEKSRFILQERIDEKNHATAEVFFKAKACFKASSAQTENIGARK